MAFLLSLRVFTMLLLLLLILCFLCSPVDGRKRKKGRSKGEMEAKTEGHDEITGAGNATTHRPIKKARNKQRQRERGKEKGRGKARDHDFRAGPDGRRKRIKPKSMLRETVFSSPKGNFTWPRRVQVALVEGNVTIGGLMMVHERSEDMICGKIMPQGGLQATEAMLYTIDFVNRKDLIPGIKLGARIKDDCDRDIYGLEQSVDFIRGRPRDSHYVIIALKSGQLIWP